MNRTDSFLINNLISNIAHAIFAEIGLDTNKLAEYYNVIRERVYACPLFTMNLQLENMTALKEAMNEFIEDCRDEILKRIV